MLPLLQRRWTLRSAFSYPCPEEVSPRGYQLGDMADMGMQRQSSLSTWDPVNQFAFTKTQVTMVSEPWLTTHDRKTVHQMGCE